MLGVGVTPAATLAAQRRFGNAAVARVVARRRMLLRDYYDEGLPGSRPGMDVGDTGPAVKLLQRLLGAKPTGVFDAQTRLAVDQFQAQQGWKPSGVGAMTWERIDNHEGKPGNRPNLDDGYRGPGVALMQKALGVQQTGYFGKVTRAAVNVFQRKQGWKPGGVGPMTWALLEHELNRLTVAQEMENEANPASPTRAVWHPSGNDADATDFSHWAMEATEDPTFTISSTTVLNCWEMVLWTAYKMKVLTWAWIHDAYMYSGADWADELAKRLTPKSAASYNRATKSPKPRRGDIVLFDGISHVAVATGREDASGPHIYSFWPPPTTAFAPRDYRKPGRGKGVAAGTPDAVKDTNIEDVAKACDDTRPGHLHTCVVTFGAPPW